MIVNIRGTSGSGKSTLIRALMERCHDVKPVGVVGRKQPLYYLAQKKEGDNDHIAFLGHYETPCGGCDTIPSMDRIYDLVRELHGEHCDVVYEGLLISAEVNRCQALHDDGHPLTVVHLDLPLQECIDSVNKRRWTKNPEKPGVNPKNTESKWKGTKRAMERLGEGGVNCYTGGREECLGYISGILHV